MNYKTLTAAYNKKLDRLGSDKDCSSAIDNCFVYNKRYLRNLLDKIDEFLIENYEKERRFLSLGFGKYDSLKKRKVLSLREPIRYYFDMLRLKVDPKLTNKELNNIVSTVTDLIGRNRKLKNNPVNQQSPEEYTSNCVPYQSWERHIYVKLGKFKITAKPVDECLGFTYDLTVKQEKEKGCKFLYNLSAHIENICNIDYVINVTDDTCKMEYDLLIKKYPNCNFSYKKYANYRHDGFTLDLIKQLEELDITTSIDEETGDYVFTTSEGNSYKSSSLLSIEEITNNL